MIDARFEGKFKGGISELLSLTTNAYEREQENTQIQCIFLLNSKVSNMQYPYISKWGKMQLPFLLFEINHVALHKS